MPVQMVIEGRSPVKVWTKDVEESALRQLQNLATLPFVHSHVAVMADVHWGMGATVGSVIPTRGAIIPAAVGVDLGCGMMAVKTNLTASDLPDSLVALRHDIEASIPHGRTDNGGKNDRGGWGETPAPIMAKYQELLGQDDILELFRDHPKILSGNVNTHKHLGTLGTGNHFVEVCLDLEQNVWVMLHSGSRGIGNRIGSYFIELAKEEMKRWFINLPDADLAYLPEGSRYFDDYVAAVGWAQNYALANREIMMDAALRALQKHTKPIVVTEMAVNCHHNYVEHENHFGANVWVTRKGAVRAKKGDLGIIPGSMGAKSFIVRGKGNKESFCSCSHGAGRKMSRGEAKRRFTIEDLQKQTEGVECRKDAAVIDEIPQAYKSIDEVMENQSDLVEVVAQLKQVLCVKG